MKIKVPAPEKLQEIFDDLTYGKGSIVCRLLAHFIGDEALFQQCMRAYLSKYRYHNATTTNLLQVMDAQTLGKLSHRAQDGTLLTVSAYITPWIEQSCFPKITISQPAPGEFQLH